MVTWSHTRVMSGGGGKPGPGGVVTAGWGTLHTAHPGQCLHLAHPAYPSPPPSLDPDQFRMSFTKQLVAGAKPSSKRRPVLVSRPRSEPWLPAGAGAGASKQRAGPPGPWCSVCADSSLTKEEVWTLYNIYMYIYISAYLHIYISIYLRIYAGGHAAGAGAGGAAAAVPPQPRLQQALAQELEPGQLAW